ncbi:hypothetical protein [Pseudomonas akapageensis]|uniref:hypothetical protein n=1 Tax=Pseudomonas akapageensis TaxID=2609961 RepID=UPI00140819BD|nr:hypothetical protein [Pseudomonas akapageensis]
MPRETLNTIMDWARSAPRTLGWDAIVAYHRDVLNALLADGYIQGFTSDRYLEAFPIEEVVTANRHWEYIENCLLDHPRLFFGDNSIIQSTASFTLRMVGGTQLSVIKNVGQRVRAVERVGPCNGLADISLVMHVNLQLNPGTLDSEGRVRLSWADGSRFFLQKDGSQELDELGAGKYRRAMEAWPAARKMFELNRIQLSPGNYWLRPLQFLVRGHHSLHNPPESAHELLLFIKFAGNDNGRLPASDGSQKYLIAEAPDLVPLTILPTLPDVADSRNSRAAEGTMDAYAVFRLHELLLPPEALYQDGWSDVATVLFGRAWDQGRLNDRVSPNEVTLGPGDRWKFTSPTSGPVEWSVRNLGGESGSAGRIGDDGSYTAPTGFSGDFKRVIVTARETGPNAGYRGSVLVTIMQQSIFVDPYVQVTSAGGPPHSIRAGNGHQTTMQWSLEPGSTGGLQSAPAGQTLYTPPASPRPAVIFDASAKTLEPAAVRSSTDRLVTLDTIKVRGLINTETSSVVVVHIPQTHFFRVEKTPAGNGLQLKFYYVDKQGVEVRVADADTQWTLLSGDGALSPQGVYTPAVNGRCRFAVIRAIEDDDQRWYWAFIVVPLPLISIDRFVSLHNG